MQITTLLPIISATLAILLTAFVLLQQPQTDSAGAFSSDSTSSRHTKRGLEKTVFQLTLVTAIAFVVVQILQLIVAR